VCPNRFKTVDSMDDLLRFAGEHCMKDELSCMGQDDLICLDAFELPDIELVTGQAAPPSWNRGVHYTVDDTDEFSVGQQVCPA